MPSSITATSGRSAAASATAAVRCGCSNCPLFFTTVKRVPSSAAIASFVVVLPALPVMATTRVPAACRTACASACSARSVSSTSITPPSPHRLGTGVPPRPARPRPPAAPARQRLGDERRARRTAARAAPRTGRRPPSSGCRSTTSRTGVCLAVTRRPAARPPRRRSSRASARPRSPGPRLDPPRLQRLARHRDVVERMLSVRRSPDTSRVPCRRSARRRRRARRAIAWRIASRRSTIVSTSALLCRASGSAPRITSSMMRAGSSLRGLSDVTTTTSLSRAATMPISGRLVRSRSPPAPKTVTRRAWPSAAPSRAGCAARRRCARSRRRR